MAPTSGQQAKPTIPLENGGTKPKQAPIPPSPPLDSTKRKANTPPAVDKHSRRVKPRLSPATQANDQRRIDGKKPSAVSSAQPRLTTTQHTSNPTSTAASTKKTTKRKRTVRFVEPRAPSEVPGQTTESAAVAPMSERPAKRQRVDGSYSPLSPRPYHHDAPSIEKPVANVEPDTPRSPPFMSTAPDVASVNKDEGHNTVSEQRPMAATAAKTDDLSNRSSEIVMGDSKDTSHTRSDHDRQKEGGDSSAAQEKPSTTTKSLADSYFFVGTKPPRKPQPFSARDNIVGLYGLQPLADELIRFKPDGTKNAIRKTYKKQLIDLELPGRPVERNAPEEFQNLSAMPEDIFQDQIVSYTPLGQDSNHLDSLLNRAFNMTNDHLSLSSEKHFRTLIGPEDTKLKKKGAVNLDNATKKPGTLTTNATPLGAGSTAGPGANAKKSASAAPSPHIRATRPGAKRSYDDSTYSGYGDGFGDDDPQNPSGEEKPKKKRKSNAGNTSGSILAPPSGYGQAHMAGSIRR